MIEGKDFPSLFSTDNYTLRHATGHNMYDPESLMTGREIMVGMTYENSRRDWQKEEHYAYAVSGENTNSIPLNGPRIEVKSNRAETETEKECRIPVKMVCFSDVEDLRRSLIKAKEAHTEYEKQNGKDEDWPKWYAQYMAE